MKNKFIKMKKLIFSFFLGLIPCLIQAQSNNIVIGRIDSVYSDILQENREIWVHVPNSGDKFPVVYLLDGSGHFRSVVGMIHQLSTVNGNTICPKMIVVGILNTNRSRDLTPTKADINHPYVDSALVETSGGGENFIAFIEKELFPYIESNCPIQPYRMIIGHSYGGLTVLHTLFHHTNLFNAYVAIDPSLWWSNQKLLKEIEKSVSDKKFDGISFYLGFANTMKEGMDTIQVMKDTTYSTMHIRSILEFKNVLAENFKNNLRFKTRFYPLDDHTSVPLITEYDAIRFIFDFYKFKFNSEDRDNPNIDLFKRIKMHYEKVSENMGYDEKPSESLVNSLGYYYLNKKLFEKAEKYFKLNVTNYPLSFSTYDAYGDYFRAIGNNNKAIENYKKSLSLNKDSYSKAKLEKLQNEINNVIQN
jgi:predicted alpha/beta superfamily hydrolase